MPIAYTVARSATAQWIPAHVFAKVLSSCDAGVVGRRGEVSQQGKMLVEQAAGLPG